MSERDEAGGAREFSTTHWSVVIEAADENAPGRFDALNTLCETYWHPLYFFMLRQGRTAHDAKDLIQGFFAKLLENNFLKSVEKNKGRFRTFLMMAAKRYSINQWNRETAKKRGGEFTHIPLDFARADNLYQRENASQYTPEKLYDRTWATTILNEAYTALEASYVKRGKGDIYRYLRTTLPGQTQVMTYKEAAESFNCSENTIKSETSRLRKRFKQTLRAIVAETVQNETEIDDEIRYLIKTLQ